MIPVLPSIIFSLILACAFGATDNVPVRLVLIVIWLGMMFSFATNN